MLQELGLARSLRINCRYATTSPKVLATLCFLFPKRIQALVYAWFRRSRVFLKTFSTVRRAEMLIKSSLIYIAKWKYIDISTVFVHPCLALECQGLAFRRRHILVPWDRGDASGPVKTLVRITLTGCLTRYSLRQSAGREAEKTVCRTEIKSFMQDFMNQVKKEESRCLRKGAALRMGIL